MVQEETKQTESFFFVLTKRVAGWGRDMLRVAKNPRHRACRATAMTDEQGPDCHSLSISARSAPADAKQNVTMREKHGEAGANVKASQATPITLASVAGVREKRFCLMYGHITTGLFRPPSVSI